MVLNWSNPQSTQQGDEDGKRNDSPGPRKKSGTDREQGEEAGGNGPEEEVCEGNEKPDLRKNIKRGPEVTIRAFDCLDRLRPVAIFNSPWNHPGAIIMPKYW